MSDDFNCVSETVNFTLVDVEFHCLPRMMVELFSGILSDICTLFPQVPLFNFVMPSLGNHLLLV